MFINCSNHPSEKWGKTQTNEAKKWGEIIDVPFPQVDPFMTEEEIMNLAETVVSNLLKKEPEVIMCQGEFSLTFAIVTLLKQHKIPVVCACSERKVVERSLSEEVVEKQALFEFVKFRQY